MAIPVNPEMLDWSSPVWVQQTDVAVEEPAAGREARRNTRWIRTRNAGTFQMHDSGIARFYDARGEGVHTPRLNPSHAIQVDQPYSFYSSSHPDAPRFEVKRGDYIRRDAESGDFYPLDMRDKGKSFAVLETPGTSDRAWAEAEADSLLAGMARTEQAQQRRRRETAAESEPTPAPGRLDRVRQAAARMVGARSGSSRHRDPDDRGRE